jgi:multimeric flavodoxin WrbA
MKALILNGERKNESALDLVAEAVAGELTLQGWQAETIVLREKKIALCTGCFGCWIKTPGVCVIDDFGREAARMVIGSNVLIYLTPITFGGYSSELKKAVDRFACSMLLPFFKKIEGEIHHQPRYQPLPSLIGIGVLPGPDEESERIFTKLIARNAINLQSPASHSAVFYNHQDPEFIRKEVRTLLGRVKV